MEKNNDLKENTEVSNNNLRLPENSKSWSDDDMIVFAEFYHKWYGHREVGTNAYKGLKKYKELNKLK